MFKGVKKGLKNTILGKGHHHKHEEEDDIFDVEKLEKLKKELAAKKKAEEGETQAGHTGTEPGPAPQQDDEEWAKFKLLTAGVDTVLKKTQEELEQIKETSFYQRKVTDPTNLWRPESEKHEEQKLQTPPPEPEPEPESEPEPQPDLTEIEPINIEDELFDTTYLDAIASGEIKLNYIPDSPTEDDGDDPFAYSSDVADVCKRVEEAERRAKRQVNLGSTVEALTGTGKGVTCDLGRRERPEAGKSGRARPRPGVNLLLGDDDTNVPYKGVISKVEVQEKTGILDEILGSSDEIPCAQIPFSSPVVVKVEEVEGEKEEDNFQDILGEFDIIRGSKEEPNQGYATASSTLLLKSILEPEDDLDDEFEAIAAESILKSPLPPRKGEEEEEEEDCFSTRFVEEIIKEQPKDEDDFDFSDFNPRAGEPQSPRAPPERSLLEEHSPTAENVPALQPNFKAQAKTGHLVDAVGQGGEKDPFDTTSTAILPGQAELRLLEEELLKAETVYPKLPQLEAKLSARPASEDEDDFDPRAEEKQPHIFDTAEEELEKDKVKILSPQQEKADEDDPFSTDYLADLNLAPGQLELKLLESELITQDNNGGKQSNNLEEDDDFDPRFGEEKDPFVVVVNSNQILATGHIFDHSDDLLPAGKVLTPQGEKEPAFPSTECAGNEDPFDTSQIIVSKLLPQSELKAIEGEILASKPPPVAGTQVKLKAVFSAPAVPLPPSEPLQPQISQFEEDQKPHLLEEEDAYHSVLDHTPMVPLDAEFDAFDTSIAEGLVPGKAEIRVLEEQLNSLTQVSDDFDPRGESSNSSQQQPVHPASLSFVSKTLQPVKLYES